MYFPVILIGLISGRYVNIVLTLWFSGFYTTYTKWVIYLLELRVSGINQVFWLSIEDASKPTTGVDI